MFHINPAPRIWIYAQSVLTNFEKAGVIFVKSKVRRKELVRKKGGWTFWALSLYDFIDILINPNSSRGQSKSKTE
jgi:hypothetical protein